MHILISSLYLTIGILFANTTKTIIPSSKIPEKREFPLNEKVSPCDNFHDYVCSSVESSFKLREDRSKHTFAFNDSAERLLLLKRKFLKNIKGEKKLSVRGEGLKNNFLACMNEKSGAIEEKKWLSEFIVEVEGLTTIDTFRDIQIENLKKGRPSLIDIGEAENSMDPMVYDLYMGIKIMNLPDHSYYENEELVKAYRDLIIDFFKEIHPEAKDNDLAKRADSIIKLEKDFIKIYPKPEVRRQRWSEKRDISQAEFLKTYKNLKLESLLQLLPKTLVMRLPIPETLKFYSDILIPENLEGLKNYYLYSAGARVMDDAYPNHFKKSFEFRHKYFGGPEKRPVREERCTMAMMATYAKELDEILLPRLFPHFPEDKFRFVVDKVRKAIVSGINENNWLSAEAKNEAFLKMSTARLQLIKPQNEREWDFHPIVNYSRTTKIKNSELLSAAEFEKMLKIIAEPVNNDKWAMGPLEINAYYDATSNKFVMPLGILQFPFYDVKGSEIANLGSVGAVVGHELGHGIDDVGSRFDEKGRLRQWMTMKDLADFSKRTSRLVDQYAAVGQNGKLTLGENIADLVGVTFGYEAAFPGGLGSIEDKKNFFISYARVWCAVIRPQMIENLLKTDPHSLGKNRINEPLKHQSGFAEAFQCKVGDKMFIPENERIKIW